MMRMKVRLTATAIKIVQADRAGNERGQARKERKGRDSGNQNQLFLCFSFSFLAMLAKFSASASMAAALFSI